jgi:hypothetical protein
VIKTLANVMPVMNPQDRLTRMMYQDEVLAALALVVSACQSTSAPEAPEVKVAPLERDSAKQLEGWHATR